MIQSEHKNIRYEVKLVDAKRGPIHKSESDANPILFTMKLQYFMHSGLFRRTTMKLIITKKPNFPGNLLSESKVNKIQRQASQSGQAPRLVEILQGDIQHDLLAKIVMFIISRDCRRRGEGPFPLDMVISANLGHNFRKQRWNLGWNWTPTTNVHDTQTQRSQPVRRQWAAFKCLTTRHNLRARNVEFEAETSLFQIFCKLLFVALRKRGN